MIFAEDINYWKTSRSSSDVWLEKAKKEIIRAGGKMIGSGSFSEDITGRAGFMLAFELEREKFTIKWPVLQSKKGEQRAAQIQSATALYHEVKSACVKAKFLGARSAFFAFLMIPDGRTMTDLATPELVQTLPSLMSGQIIEGEVIE